MNGTYFEYQNKSFFVKISDVKIYPQDYAALMPSLGKFIEYPRIVAIDIGGFTADYLVIRKGRADWNVCDSLELGIIQLYNGIISGLRADNILLEEQDIDNIFSGQVFGYNQSTINYVNKSAQHFVNDLLGKLRELEIDLHIIKPVFIGGGALLLRKYIEKSGLVKEPSFIEDIQANAKGYMYLYRVLKEAEIRDKK